VFRAITKANCRPYFRLSLGLTRLVCVKQGSLNYGPQAGSGPLHTFILPANEINVLKTIQKIPHHYMKLWRQSKSSLAGLNSR
jgi:hypothetical protein